MQNSIEKTTVTPVVYTYRYMWKDKKGSLCVKFLTEPLEGHKKFIEQLRKDENIVSCAREYCHEINFAFIGFSEPVKIEKKEENTKKEGE